ncbi:serine hydrolase [Metabacillus idriensis]|uniref:serine hydrolase n=1 Tax=Metabacillus idriensis TaxID=324768 RepID=UPI0017494F7E|nr:serine hydrolase [Metabacillus idriensis]
MTGTFKLKLQELIDRYQGRVGLSLELDGDLYEWNSTQVFPSASLIKLPILLTAFRQKEQGILDFDEIVTIAEMKMTSGAGVLQALSESAVLSIADMVTLMIMVSDNMATNLLINKIGVSKVRDFMDELNLSGTELNRQMMDFAAIDKGLNNWTTSSDMLKCLKAIGENDFLTDESKGQIAAILQKQQFTDKLSFLMDTEKIVIGSKTGDLHGVEHDCAIIQFKERTVYAAVLMDEIVDKRYGRSTINEIGRLIYEELVR